MIWWPYYAAVGLINVWMWGLLRALSSCFKLQDDRKMGCDHNYSSVKRLTTFCFWALCWFFPLKPFELWGPHIWRNSSTGLNLYAHSDQSRILFSLFILPFMHHEKLDLFHHYPSCGGTVCLPPSLIVLRSSCKNFSLQRLLCWLSILF